MALPHPQALLLHDEQRPTRATLVRPNVDLAVGSVVHQSNLAWDVGLASQGTDQRRQMRGFSVMVEEVAVKARERI